MKDFFLCLLSPLKPLYRLWMKFAHFIGRISTAVFLTFFYVIFLGVAKLVTVLARKDLMDAKWKDRPSYWKKRDFFKADKESLLKPY